MTKSLFEKLIAWQGKIGTLTTLTRSMQIGIDEIHFNEGLLKYITPDALEKLNPEINKPEPERDRQKIKKILNDENNYDMIKIDAILDFVPAELPNLNEVSTIAKQNP